MLFIYGEIVMRILSKRQLKELVLYSPQHVARLEKAGGSPSGYNSALTEWDGWKRKCWNGFKRGWTTDNPATLLLGV